MAILAAKTPNEQTNAFWNRNKRGASIFILVCWTNKTEQQQQQQKIIKETSHLNIDILSDIIWINLLKINSKIASPNSVS